jgi:hypothetical protein
MVSSRGRRGHPLAAGGTQLPQVRYGADGVASPIAYRARVSSTDTVLRVRLVRYFTGRPIQQQADVSMAPQKRQFRYDI